MSNIKLSGHETPAQISGLAVAMHDAGDASFTDVIVEWLLSRGIAMTIEDVASISKVFEQWRKKRGDLKGVKGKDLADYILKMLDVQINDS